MPQYTLFFLDWDDLTVATEDIDAPDDATALSIAAQRKRQHADVEVMCGTRTVGRPALKAG
jgi:hypothetical protein